MKNLDWLELLICIALASFGGIVKRLADLEKDPEKDYNATHYITAAIMSTFVGIIVYVLCKNFNVSTLLTAGLTAMAGFIGTPIIYLLSNLSVKRLKAALKDWVKDGE